jgi:hypothetical protein
MVMGSEGPETKNSCAGEGQQHVTGLDCYNCRLYRIVRVLSLFVVTSDRHSINSVMNPNPVSSQYYQMSLNTHSVRVYETIFTCVLPFIPYIHRSRKYGCVLLKW